MAKEYIERVAALKGIIQDGCTVKNINTLLSIPAADVVKVVRCKDCKYLGFKGLCYGYCKHKMCGLVNPNDFCSYGERRKRTSE